MNRQEVLERLKKGEKLTWVQWGNRRYGFMDGPNVRSPTIKKLIREGKVQSFRYKSSPLMGVIKLRETNDHGTTSQESH